MRRQFVTVPIAPEAVVGVELISVTKAEIKERFGVNAESVMSVTIADFDDEDFEPLMELLVKSAKERAFVPQAETEES